MYGYLLMKKGLIKGLVSWERMYFDVDLKSLSLQYAEQPRDEAVGRIALPGATISLVSDGKGKRFLLTTAKRKEYLFKAKDPELCADWTRVLNYVVCHGGLPPTVPKVRFHTEVSIHLVDAECPSRPERGSVAAAKKARSEAKINSFALALAMRYGGAGTMDFSKLVEYTGGPAAEAASGPAANCETPENSFSGQDVIPYLPMSSFASAEDSFSLPANYPLHHHDYNDAVTPTLKPLSKASSYGSGMSTPVEALPPVVSGSHDPWRPSRSTAATPMSGSMPTTPRYAEIQSF